MLIVLTGAWFIWATLPPGRVVFGPSCEPEGTRAVFSETIYRRVFWRTQLRAATVERDRLLTQPARMARMEEEAATHGGATSMRMSRLSSDPADAAERARREEADQAKRLARIALLSQCVAVIERRMGR